MSSFINVSNKVWQQVLQLPNFRLVIHVDISDTCYNVKWKWMTSATNSLEVLLILLRLFVDISNWKNYYISLIG